VNRKVYFIGEISGQGERSKFRGICCKQIESLKVASVFACGAAAMMPFVSVSQSLGQATFPIRRGMNS
jgi:hypothetical protein